MKYVPNSKALEAKRYLEEKGYHLFWLSGKVVLEKGKDYIKVSKENYPKKEQEKLIDKKAIDLMNHLKNKKSTNTPS